MIPWLLVGLVVGAGIVVAAGGVGGQRLLLELRELRAERDQLVESDATTAQGLEALKDLERNQRELVRKVQQITVDRDNLLAQLKIVQEDRDETAGVRNLLERMLQKTGEENRELRERVEPAERELGNLRGQWEQLVKDRDQLQIEVDQYRTRSKEKKRREQVATLRETQRTLKQELHQVKQAFERTSRHERKLSKDLEQLDEHYTKLQGKYAKEVRENTSLRHEVNQLPKDVNRLAREHERLLKELADTHYNMGVMFFERRDFGRAVKEFRQVVELRPSDADAHYNLGVIYAEHLPDREKAIAVFRRYLQVEPQGQEASYARKYIATWRAWEGAERLE